MQGSSKKASRKVAAQMLQAVILLGSAPKHLSTQWKCLADASTSAICKATNKFSRTIAASASSRVFYRHKIRLSIKNSRIYAIFLHIYLHVSQKSLTFAREKMKVRGSESSSLFFNKPKNT